jgi:hypothetical protein
MQSLFSSSLHRSGASWLRLGVAGLSLLVLTASSQAQRKYIVQDLGEIGGAITLHPARVNMHGDIAGHFLKSQGSGAFYATQGLIFDIGALPGHASASARWLNRHGILIGTSGEGAARRAFLWQNGTMVQVPHFAGQPTEGAAINDNSNYAFNLMTAPRAFVVRGPNSVEVPPLGLGMEIKVMNNRDRVAGVVRLLNGFSMFQYDPPDANGNERLQEINVRRQGDVYSQPNDITHNSPYAGTESMIVGVTGWFTGAPFAPDSHFMPQGFLFSNTTYYLPNLPNNNLSEANGMQSVGPWSIVGRSGHAQIVNNKPHYVWTPVFWECLRLSPPLWAPRNIYDLLPPGTTQNIQNLTSINDSGQIAAVSEQAGRYRSLLLTPVLTPVNLILNPQEVAGGLPSVGTVIIDGNAPVGGYAVNITSNNGIAQVPSTVTVPQNEDRVQFPITTSPVSVPTSVTITAERHGYTRSAMLVVNPVELLWMSVHPVNVTGGLTATGTARLNGPAPSGGMTVMLSTSRPDVATVPASVTVQPGQIFANFTVSTKVVTQRVDMLLIGRRGNVERTTQFSVVTPFIQSLTLSLGNVFGGNSVQGTVRLTNNALPPGATIQLTSSSPSVLQVPSSVAIPTGQIAAQFTATTTRVPFNITVTVTARFNQSTATATVVVLPYRLDRFSIHPTTVLGSHSATGTVRIDHPAPAGGLPITIVSGNPGAARAPETVMVPEGQQIAFFTITTSILEQNTDAPITARYLNVTLGQTLHVLAAQLDTHAIVPPTIQGGLSAQGQLGLTRPAQAGGALVRLFSNIPQVIVPAQVTIPEGQQNFNYTVQTQTVGTTTQGEVTAVRGTITRVATITLTP